MDLTAPKITIKCFIQKVLRPRNHGNIGQFIICPLARLSGSIHFFFPRLSLQPAKIFCSFRSSFVANWRRQTGRVAVKNRSTSLFLSCLHLKTILQLSVHPTIRTDDVYEIFNFTRDSHELLMAFVKEKTHRT